MAKVVLKNVRCSFLNVFKAVSYNNGDPKYGVQLIVPKDHKGLEAFEKAVLEVAKEKFPSKVKGSKISASLKMPLRDGDIERDEYPDIYENTYFFSASSSRRPQVFDRDKSALAEDDGVMYSGCYVNASLNVYAFDVQGNKGVAVGLNGLQFVKDGEPLGGNSDSTDDFEELDGEDDLV